MSMYNDTADFSTSSDGWVTDVYETTPVMAPFRLGFLVSDFSCIERTTHTGTRVSDVTESVTSLFDGLFVEVVLTILKANFVCFVRNLPSYVSMVTSNLWS